MKELLLAAKNARGKAYAPYSKFKVGAAVKSSTGVVYEGANVENVSFSLTCCAERVAIFAAVTAGESSIDSMLVIGDTDEPISPCGACRQVISEFFTEETAIYLANIKGDVIKTTISQLLPDGFGANNFKLL